MSQPQLTEGPPVPLMVEGLLDENAMRQLFSDLAAAAVIHEVREKSASTASTTANDLTLEIAQERLLSRQARAIQVRYHYADHEWSDTLFAMPKGFRIVRCRHDATA